MFLLLEIVGKYSKIESKSKINGKLSHQDVFLVSDYFISSNSYFT